MNIESKRNSSWMAITACRFAICVWLCCFVLSGDLLAQENYARQEPPRKKSAMEKLSELNQKLKQNLKENLFGNGSTMQSEQNGRLDNGSYRRPSQQQARFLPDEYQAPRRSDDYGSPQPDSRTLPKNSNRLVSQAQHMQEIEYDHAPSQYNDYPELQYKDSERMDPRLIQVPENRFRQSDQQMADLDRRDQIRASQQYAPIQDRRQQQAVNGFNARPPLGEHYGARSGMPYPPMQMQQKPVQQQYVAQSYQDQQAPESMPQQPYREQPNGEFRSGHYKNGRGVTQQQFDHQETATQRALRLRTENQALMDTRQSLTAENKRLKNQLSDKNALLQEIESAIIAARTELQNANENNASLSQQIANLEAENAQQRLLSTRQLNAIRKKLDDVLMLEMTSK